MQAKTGPIGVWRIRRPTASVSGRTTVAMYNPGVMHRSGHSLRGLRWLSARRASSSTRSSNKATQNENAQRRKKVIVAVVSLYNAIDKILKMDNIQTSLSKKLRAYIRLSARKYGLKNARNAAAALTLCAVAIVDLLGMVGITIDVSHMKLALSSELEIIIKLVRGDGDVDLTPLIVALLTKLGEPFVEQVRSTLKSMPVVTSATSTWCEKFCGKK